MRYWLTWVIFLFLIAPPAKGEHERAIVRFHSQTCPPCRALERVFAGVRIKGKIGGRYRVYSVDISKNRRSVSDYRISVVPTTVIIETKDGITREIGRRVGYMGENELLDFIGE